MFKAGFGGGRRLLDEENIGDEGTGISEKTERVEVGGVGEECDAGEDEGEGSSPHEGKREAVPSSMHWSQADGSRGGETLSHSPNGTPPSSESQTTCLPFAGIGLEGSSKKSRIGSFSTPPLGAVKLPLGPPFALKDEKGVPLRYSRAPTNYFLTPQSLELERENNLLLAGELMRAVLSSGDRRLLAPLSQEELERSESQWRKLEDKIERLNADVAKLKEEKKDFVNRNQSRRRC
ncbi:UNVERIFIED_CONTAM: hypothetical protein Sangu_2245200 [Sesamum angustifolium]|uniref:Uncharacterized protein n=1 Tax=Sesamum angustifolium TaxID=2727405 RepID=A0AAW2L5H5_9LAMI